MPPESAARVAAQACHTVRTSDINWKACLFRFVDQVYLSGLCRFVDQVYSGLFIRFIYQVYSGLCRFIYQVYTGLQQVYNL